MAQPKLEEILKDVSVRAGDTVTTASADGFLFTSQDRLDAVNSARKVLYREMISQLGLDEFIKQYPEFIKSSGNIAKIKTENVGVFIPFHANNSYTDATRIITINVANVNFTDGVTNFNTGADFKNAFVILTYLIGGLYPFFITNIEEVISGTQVKLKTAYGADIAGSNLMAIIAVIDQGYYPRPSGARRVIEVIDGGGTYVKEIMSRLKFDSKNNQYSKFAGSATFPKYFEDFTGVEVNPDAYNSIQANLLTEPETAQLGAFPDITEPIGWLEDIKETATMILLSDQQI